MIRKLIRPIVVFTGVFGGALLITWATTGWDNAVELAKCFAFMACFGLCMLPIAMFVTSELEK